jgi:hypothetical protein
VVLHGPATVAQVAAAVAAAGQEQLVRAVYIGNQSMDSASGWWEQPTGAETAERTRWAVARNLRPALDGLNNELWPAHIGQVESAVQQLLRPFVVAGVKRVWPGHYKLLLD